MDVSEKKSGKGRRGRGSALILAVVLTSLLAIIGLLFVMSSRADKTATVAISDNKELKLAVDTVVAKIAQELAMDVPHADPLRPLQEYYDYPDANNAWLAMLEPDQLGGWAQITNIYSLSGSSQRGDIVPDYQPVVYQELGADADADGVSDSRWVRVEDMTSSKGEPIYAAVRVVGTGGMLNVNTGFKFDPDVSDGSSLMEINVVALSYRPPLTGYDVLDANALRDARSNNDPVLALDFGLYERNVVWRPSDPLWPYTPFDISDELELRYRFLVNNDATDTRLEEWGGELRKATYRRPTGGGGDRSEWLRSVYDSGGLDPNYAYRHIATTYNIDRIIMPDGARMVNVNKDKYDIDLIFNVIWKNPDPDPRNPIDMGVTVNAELAAQMAVNIKDYVDEDSVVTAFSTRGGTFYGFESPCVYISELAYNAAAAEDGNDIDHMSYAVELHRHPNDVNKAINWELWIDGYSDTHGAVDVSWSTGGQYYIVRWQDPCVPLGVISREPNAAFPADGAKGVDVNAVLVWPDVPGANSYNVYLGESFDDVNGGAPGTFQGKQDSNSYDPNGAGSLSAGTTYYWRIEPLDGGGIVIDSGEVLKFTTCPSGSDCSGVQDIKGDGGQWSYGERVFGAGDKIELRRPVTGAPGGSVVVDSVTAPAWLVGSYEAKSLERDVTPHKCIRRLWDKGGSMQNTLTLGISNRFEHPDKRLIQAHPADANLVNIGEIGMVFSRGAYYEEGGDPIASGTIGYRVDVNSDGQVRIDVNKAIFQPIFNYLTVFDPSRDRINNDSDLLIDETDLDQTPELKIAGRININTAPWYVIRQLPWMRPEIAQAVVAYRDATGGFKSIGELNNVVMGDPL
ncbi:MAG: ComEA family DNA-binding protein, partial [Planctomycetota bacterium]